MQEKPSKDELKDRNIQALLIEDDPEDTMLLMNIMAKPGWPSFKFTLLCADDLKSGLKILEEGGIEVVLLDLMLPDSQGIDTVIKLRAKASDVPIVVLTGMQDENMGLEAIKHGAQDYQVKGNLEGHSLKRTLSYAVERHRMLAGLKNIINGAKDGTLVTDSQGMVCYANPSAETLFGQSTQNLIGKPFPYPLPRNGIGELSIPFTDGSARTAEVRVSEIEWKNDPALLISIRDITDLRRIEQLKAEVRERQHMDKLKDELMNAVSHEMRSPLTIIRAISSDLLETSRRSNNKQITHALELQHKNVLRLQKILDDILDLSRLESGKASFRIQRVDILPLTREVIEGFRLVAREKQLAIEDNLPANLPSISADPDLFIQVLNNLFSNAVRFAKNRIFVRAQEAENPSFDGQTQRSPRAGNEKTAVLTARKCVQISVIDDGPGIPQDRLHDIFNKFVQINRESHGTGYKGTGLGLAICKEIVERHGGRIWVESEEGHGAGFHFTLPHCEPEFASKQGGKNGKTP